MGFISNFHRNVETSSCWIYMFFLETMPEHVFHYEEENYNDATTRELS